MQIWKVLPCAEGSWGHVSLQSKALLHFQLPRGSKPGAAVSHRCILCRAAAPELFSSVVRMLISNFTYLYIFKHWFWWESVISQNDLWSSCQCTSTQWKMQNGSPARMPIENLLSPLHETCVSCRCTCSCTLHAVRVKLALHVFKNSSWLWTDFRYWWSAKFLHSNLSGWTLHLKPRRYFFVNY